jgi:flavodoxin
MPGKCSIILFSYHHNNTQKIADIMAGVLDAEIQKPEEVDANSVQGYALIGFGSGIYDSKHHTSLFKLMEKLPQVSSKKAFIFSTCGVPAFGMNREYMTKNHSLLREKLQNKGYVVVDEFSCVGLNTNAFLRFTGGMNKGRPNAEDLKNAEQFAQKLKQHLLEAT